MYMKKILLMMVMVITSSFAFTQTKEDIYPKFVSDSTGDYVLMTVEQARSIDNDLELLYHIQAVIDTKTNTDDICVKVIDKLKQEREVLRLNINKLEEINSKKDDKIHKLNTKIDELSIKGELYESEIKNTEEIIKEKDKIIKKHKRQKVIAFGVAIIVIIISLI